MLTSLLHATRSPICSPICPCHFPADLNAAGVIVAYTLGHGYIALITGISGVITCACTLCDCCKAKGEAAPADAAGVVVASKA